MLSLVGFSEFCFSQYIDTVVWVSGRLSGL